MDDPDDTAPARWVRGVVCVARRALGWPRLLHQSILMLRFLISAAHFSLSALTKAANSAGAR